MNRLQCTQTMWMDIGIYFPINSMVDYEFSVQLSEQNIIISVFRPIHTQRLPYRHTSLGKKLEEWILRQ